jgi:hypothetical protein
MEKGMTTTFKVGDRVRWNSEGGEVEGRITKVHTKDVEFMGRMRRCSPDEPQYEVTSDKTGNDAMHKTSALTKL